MIHVGVDLHQRFCYMTALEARGQIREAGAVANEKGALRRWFRRFRSERVEVAVEACGFWPAFREVVEPEVARLVLVHPQRVKAIASAKLKNDRVDSETLAHLLRCGCRSPGRRTGRRRRGGSRCGCARRWCDSGRG